VPAEAGRALSRSHFEAALYSWPRQARAEPPLDVNETVEPDNVARFIKADQIAHPAEQRDVGNAVIIAHNPGALSEPRVEDPEQARGFGRVAVTRALVFIILAGKFVEKAKLPENGGEKVDHGSGGMSPLRAA